jgi:hypothetical protein
MQDSQSTAKKRLIRGLTRTIKWLVGMGLVALIVAGFVLTNLPKISAEVSGSLRSNDPMGAVFSVSNEGSRPVYDVNAGCEITAAAGIGARWLDPAGDVPGNARQGGVCANALRNDDASSPPTA